MQDDISIKIAAIEENQKRSSENILSFLQKIDARLSDIESKFNPIVVELFDSTILVGGGQKAPPT